MKTFIDTEETFAIEIPTEWHFTNLRASNNAANPYSFEPYSDQELSFQISIKEQPKNFRIKTEIQPSGSKDLKLDDVSLLGLNASNMKGWYGYVGDKLIIITLTYNPNLSSERIAAEIDKAEKSKRTFILLDDNSREFLVPKIRWNNLILAHAASIDLSNRAFKNGSHLELVVLLGNQIDSILRQAIILKKQLANKSDSIDIGLIHQKEHDKPIFEKAVYKFALDLEIIDDKTHKDLHTLYDVRNKSIHRFIISDLRTDDIIQLVWSYSQLTRYIGKALKGIEQEQFLTQIGIFKGDQPPDSPVDSEMFDELISSIKDKHGNRRMNNDISFKNENSG